MAFSILLLYMVATGLSHVQSRPIDFVCDSEARRVMNKVKQLEADMEECSVVTFLPVTIRLPCIKVHKASWERKSVQEKRDEILLSLRNLAQDVQAAKTLSQPGCGLALLERLEHSTNNYLHIVTHLVMEGGEPELQGSPCLSQGTQDLGLVLRNFGRLLTGKLEWLFTELAQKCHTETFTFKS